jgi:hypothetical protein
MMLRAHIQEENGNLVFKIEDGTRYGMFTIYRQDLANDTLEEFFQRLQIFCARLAKSLPAMEGKV